MAEVDMLVIDRQREKIIAAYGAKYPDVNLPTVRNITQFATTDLLIEREALLSLAEELIGELVTVCPASLHKDQRDLLSSIRTEGAV